MKGIKFSIIGYANDKKLTNIIRFLVDCGGAIYKEKLDEDIDILVVNYIKYIL